MVSPIFASATTLMLATTKPTSPTPSSSTGVAFGENTPSSSHLVVLLLRHQPDLRLRPQHAVDHADDDHDAAVGVVPGVEDQRLERRVGIALRRRNRSTIASRMSRTPMPSLALARIDGRGVEADDVLDLPLALVGLRARQIDLVDDRDDLEVVVHGQVGVGQRLRLDALRGIDHQQRALAGGQRARDLVAEVHVAGRVDQVEDVLLAVLRPCNSGGPGEP